MLFFSKIVFFTENILNLGKVPKTGWGGVPFFARPSAAHESPPHFRRHLGTPPHLGWSSRVPPIPDELLPSPPFPKIYFFQKVRMRFATFLYYPKRHDVIKFKVLCHWISLIWMTRSANKLIWMGKTLKLGDMRAQREFFLGMVPVPPPFSSLK